MKLRALTLAIALLLLGGGKAEAAKSPVTHAPTLLWNTYPLVQDPFSSRYRIHAVASTAPFQSLPLEATPSGTGSGNQSRLLLLLVIVSLGPAVLGLFIVRSALAYVPSGRETARRSRPAEPAEGGDILTALQPSPVVPGLQQAEPSPEITATRRAVPQAKNGERRAEMRSRTLRTRAERSVGTRVDTCRVTLWRGELTSQLYAESDIADGSWRPFEVSGYFRLEDEDVPATNALAALENLIAQLEDDGWAVISEGPHWYEIELERDADEPRTTAE